MRVLEEKQRAIEADGVAIEERERRRDSEKERKKEGKKEEREE